MNHWLKFAPALTLACALISQAAMTSPAILTTQAQEVDGVSIVGHLSTPQEGKIKVNLAHCEIRIEQTPDYNAADSKNNFDFTDAKFKNASREDQRMIYNAWSNSDAGKKNMAKRRQMWEDRNIYNTKPDADGNFKFTKLDNAKFFITVKVYHYVDGKKTNDVVAEFATRFSVKDAQQKDLGDIKLQPLMDPKIGEMAPTFAIKTIYGKDFKLEDLRGKFVLIDFWAVWCGPCRAETPNVKAAHEKFGGERFEVLALSLDDKTDAPVKYAKDHGLTYTHGFLGRGGVTDVAKKYGIKGIPSMWLIDPNGKIIAKKLRGKAIGQAVKNALDADKNAKKI